MTTATILCDLRREMASRSELADLEQHQPHGNVAESKVAPSDALLEWLSASAGGAMVRALCVNLTRRPDRWRQFVRTCPIRGVERFAAVDGRRVRPPAWWSQGGGAWGCLLSHLRILEQALAGGFERSGGVLLVLEDDALFPPDFVERAERFLRALPKDWDQVYFGGQHRGLRVRPPARVNDEVIRPYMVNRTQAYAVRGRFILTLYRHLCDWPSHARSPRHHLDHRMELLHASGRHRIYAPTRWIVGQAGGRSDISGRVAQDRFWNFHVSDLPVRGTQAGRRERDTPSAPRPDATGGGDVPTESDQRRNGGNESGQRRNGRNGRRQAQTGQRGRIRFTPAVRKPPVWVIGLHRSGSSVTAGILHRLGVHMGNRLIGYENRGTGGFEAHGLATICEQAYPFPSIEPNVDRETTSQQLRVWLDARMREATHRGTIAGGKYPHLCFLIDILLELEPASRFIHIDRPIDESIRSLIDRSAKARGWLHATPEQCERLQRALDAAKRSGLAKVESLSATLAARTAARATTSPNRSTFRGSITRCGSVACRGSTTGAKSTRSGADDALSASFLTSSSIMRTTPTSDGSPSGSGQSATIFAPDSSTPDSSPLDTPDTSAAPDLIITTTAPTVLTIQYHNLLSDPAREVDRIIDYLGLTVRPQQRRHAIALVEPRRKRH